MSFGKLIKGAIFAAGLGTAAVSGEAQAKEPIRSPAAATENVDKPVKSAEHPVIRGAEQRIKNIKFADNYSEDEREEIKEFLNTRMEIMKRLKFLIDIDRSGTDKKALMSSYNGKMVSFDKGLQAIESHVIDASRPDKFRPTEKISNDPLAINNRALQVRTSMIERVGEQEDSPGD